MTVCSLLFQGSGSEDSTRRSCLRLCLTMACALDQAVVVSERVIWGRDK